MSEQSLKDKTVKGVLWRFLSQLCTNGVSFVVGIILARLLGPEAYGTVALLTIFISISGELVNGGFGMPLIQKKNISQTDLNSVFYLQISMSAFLYLLLFLCAPVIADFYNEPALVNLLRIQALILPISAVSGLQSAVLSRNLKFNISFRVNVVSSVTSAIVGVSMAYSGYGYWALVAQQLVGAFCSMLTMWYFVRWIPTLTFSIKSLKEMFKMGWKMLAAGFADNFFSEITGVVIGKFYSPANLAYYNRGRTLPSTAMGIINSSLSVVAFPALSKLQTEPERLKDAMRKIIQVSTFFVMPLLAGLSAVAQPVILILFGGEWINAAPFVSIACFSFSLYPFATTNLQAIKALGRSDYYLTLSLAKDMVAFVVLLCSCRYGVLAVALAGAFVSAPISMFINAWPNYKLLGYGMLSQVYDVLPVMMMSLGMAALVWAMKLLPISNMYLLLTLQVITGAMIYYLEILLFRPRAFRYACQGLPVLRKIVPYEL